MKKIILIVMLLVAVCSSCFAGQGNNEPNWINCGSRWEFDASNMALGERNNSIGFSDTVLFVSLKRETPNVITYCRTHFEPKSLNPYVFKVQSMHKFIMSTLKMKEVNPPVPDSFEDPGLAKAICNYAGIEIR